MSFVRGLSRISGIAVLGGLAGFGLPLSSARAALPGDPAVAGLAVQVNEGEPVPDMSVFKAFLRPGQTVRDALGWRRVEHSKGGFQLPQPDADLYARVAAAGGKNVVSLFSGNELYGMKSDDFPVTPEQIEGFANFAAWVVGNDGAGHADARAANIPNLYAVTVWNEMNGTWHGTIQKTPDREAAMAALLKALVPKIRAANPAVHIAAGAFVGFQGLAEWFRQIGKSFDWSSVDWLDIHPYFGDQKAAPLEQWTEAMQKLRAGNPGQGIPPIRNPAYYSEWGGPSAVHYEQAHASDPAAPNYFEWFDQNVVGADPVPVAGGDYFTLVSNANFPRQGLTKNASSAADITELGTAFRARYLATSGK
jgi:hypothetical protein